MIDSISGLHVREKAKQLSILLQDDERLKNERARALKAKERFAQSTSAFGSDGTLDTPSSPAFPTVLTNYSCFSIMMNDSFFCLS